MNIRYGLLCGISASILLLTQAGAQTAQIRPAARIHQRIDESKSITVRGNVHPLIAASFAKGTSTPVDDSTPMEDMILHLKSDPSQDAQLVQLIAQQGDPRSPLYHHYLTPQEFGSQFGVAAPDIGIIAGWLQSHGFTIGQVTAGNRSIIFSGTAGQVASAFKTQIHKIEVSGKGHMGNVSDPQIPTALADVVGGIVQLNDFQAGNNIVKTATLAPATLSNPLYTSGGGHYLSPADFSTIYDTNPLYSGGITGAGQSIAIVSRANIAMSDVDTFRSTFGLVSNDPQILIVTNDPGMQAGGNTMEATLDVEWAGAVAPHAAVKLVVGQCTNTIDGILAAETYAVNNNVAPIVSVSYGLCEAVMGTTYVEYMSSLWQQAAAQGQSVFVSSGDTGAAGCNSQSDTTGSGAGVNGLCSSPYSTCVGGTEFVDESNPSQYWLPGNDAVGGSAISYIPETTWNESGSNGGSGVIGGGGGVSTVFSKPAWQAGPGVPSDGKRDVPDVALSAAGHDGYLIYEYEGGLFPLGGTSFSTPSFAGLMALVSQKAGGRQGLPNPVLYALASKQASGGASVFNDINTGNNSVPGVTGYSAGLGYDLATGLGSVDASVLVNHWSDGVTGLSLTASSGSLAVNAGQLIHVTVTSLSGLDSAVALSTSGAPAGVTTTFSSTSIASPGSGSVSLTIATTSSTKPGSYTLTVAGSSAGQTATLSLPFVIGAPSFTLVPSKSSLVVELPSSTPVTITTAAQTGFNAALALSVSGAPSGVTATLSSKTVAAPGTGGVLLTVAVATSTTPGTYQLAVSGQGGGQTQTAYVSLEIPTFTVTAPSGYYTTSAGGTVAFPVTITPQAGFGSTISLKPRAGYLPSGITTSFAPATVSGSSDSTSTVTMTVSKTIANGAYPFFIDGTGGNITSGAYEWLLVGIQGSCTLAVYNNSYSSNSMPVTAGKSVTGEEVCLWPQGSFTAPLNVSFSGVPSGVTVQPSGHLLGDGNFVPLNVSVAQSVMPGTYNMLIQASSTGGYSGSYPFSIVVAGDSFSLSASKSAFTLSQGSNAPVSVTTAHNGIFNAAVSLAWSGLPSGVTASLAKSSFSAPGDGATTATFVAASNALPGIYTVTLTATGGGITRTWPFTVTVVTPSCTFAASAKSLSLAAGQSSPVTLSCGSVVGTFGVPLALSVTGAPEGTTATAPSTMTAGGSATLQISTPISMAATNYSISVKATSGSFSATVPIAVTLSASNFTMTSTLTALTITQGNLAQVTSTTTHHGVFNSPVNLTWSGLPTGVTASISKSVFAAPGDGTAISTFSVSYSAAPGAHTVTLTASGGGVTRTIPVTLTVASGPTAKINVTAPFSPAAFNPGQSGAFSVSVNSIVGNFTAPLSVSITGAPAGTTAKLLASSMSTSSGGQFQLTVPQNATASSFTLKVTGTSSGGFTTTTSIPITIK